MAAETRVQAIRSQLSACMTLCKIVTTEIDYGHLDKARELVGRLRKMANTVQRHLDEPRHVPTEYVYELRKELANLEAKILRFEEFDRVLTVARPASHPSGNVPRNNSKPTMKK
jgi:hypothetical protein